MIHVTAKIVDGEVTPYESIQYYNELKKLEGQDIEITINSIRIRSNLQNRYYWGTLIYMIKECLIDQGWQASDMESTSGTLTREMVHELMKEMFARQEIYLPHTGEVIGSTSRSTSDMSTKDFKSYVDNIRQWAIETLTLDIPDPTHLYSI